MTVSLRFKVNDGVMGQVAPTAGSAGAEVLSSDGKF